MAKLAKWQIIAEKVLLKSSVLTYRCATFFGSIPFEVASDTELLVRYGPGHFQKVKWYGINAIAQICYMFLWYSFIRNFIFSEGPQGLNASTAVHLMVINLYSYNSLYHATLLGNPDTCMNLINQLTYTRTIHEKEGADGKPMRKWTSVLLSQLMVPYLSLLVIILIPGALGILHLVKPDMPFQPYYYLPEGWKNYWTNLLSALAQTYTHMAAGSILPCAFIYWNQSIFQVMLWQKQILKGCRNHMELPRWIRCYRRVLLLTRMHNDFNGRFFTTIYYVVTSGMCTICIVISLTGFNQLPLLVYLLFPVTATFTFYLLTVWMGCHAMWGILSPQVLSQLEKQGQSLVDQNRKLWLRQVRSLFPMRNEYQPFGYTEDSTGQALVEQVFSGVLLLISN